MACLIFPSPDRRRDRLRVEAYFAHHVAIDLDDRNPRAEFLPPGRILVDIPHLHGGTSPDQRQQFLQ